jgi:AcrR family transcriptional regulator
MDPQQLVSESRLERKKEDTRQKILTTAMQMFRKYGFESVSMEAIAEAVDIAKGTLYNYFPIKEAILDEYIRRNFKEQNEARIAKIQGLPDTASRMETVFADLLTGIQSQKVIFEKYVAYRMKQWISFRQEDHEKSGFQLFASEIIRLGQRDGELRNDLPAQMLEDLCEYVFMLAVKEFYLAPKTFSASHAIERSVNIFLNGTKLRK